MPRIVENRFFQFTAVALAVFLTLLNLMPTPRFVELMNSIFIFVAVAFGIVLAPGIWRAVIKRDFDRASQAAVGIVCLMLSIVVSRIGNVAGRILGDFDRVANSPLIAVAVYLAIIGSLLLVTAPGMVEGKWRYNRGLVIGAITAGLVMAVVVYFAQISVFQ